MINPKYAQALQLYMGGHSIADISKELNISQNTLKVWVYKGVKGTPPWSVLNSPDAFFQHFSCPSFSELGPLMSLRNAVFSVILRQVSSLTVTGNLSRVSELENLWSFYMSLTRTLQSKYGPIQDKIGDENDVAFYEQQGLSIPKMRTGTTAPTSTGSLDDLFADGDDQ